MGTTYTVRIAAPPAHLTQYRIRTVIEEELRAVDISMSTYRPDSEISRFNATSSTEWFDTSAELAALVNAALEVGKSSRGAFDITVAPLVRLWGFGPDASEGSPAPDQSEVTEARETIGLARVQVRAEPPALRKDTAALQVDLNGIVPGYAVDRISARFEKMDVRDYLVDIGGEIRARGRNRDGEPWRVAVERPRDERSRPFMVLSIDGKAVATSGGYRHYIERGGERVTHTIDPRTGYPIVERAASVVVIHDEGMYADAWATAMNVLGPEEGYALAVQLDIAAMFVLERDGSFQPKATPAFEPFILVAAQPR